MQRPRQHLQLRPSLRCSLIQPKPRPLLQDDILESGDVFAQNTRHSNGLMGAITLVDKFKQSVFPQYPRGLRSRMAGGSSLSALVGSAVLIIHIYSTPRHDLGTQSDHILMALMMK